MTDLEYDILDELYFVISFSELQQKMSLEENTSERSASGVVGSRLYQMFQQRV